MGDLNEIVSAAAVSKLFVLLAVLLPFAAALVGGVYGVRHHNVRRYLLLGLGCGLIGPVNWALWRVYNTITAHNGLDTVRNFGINLVVFIVIGIGIGLVLGRIGRALNAAVDTGPVEEKTSDLDTR